MRQTCNGMSAKQAGQTLACGDPPGPHVVGRGEHVRDGPDPVGHGRGWDG
ncbi:MAG: hypothetical protein KAT70_00645 [Thermoplasmata archaeon]|nr:hypothetical protein [Thermoplasmata archaeon]